ncbi:MAG: hypothetical protein ACK55I_25870, partial [bacterium]
ERVGVPAAHEGGVVGVAPARVGRLHHASAQPPPADRPGLGGRQAGGHGRGQGGGGGQAAMGWGIGDHRGRILGHRLASSDAPPVPRPPERSPKRRRERRRERLCKLCR